MTFRIMEDIDCEQYRRSVYIELEEMECAAPLHTFDICLSPSIRNEKTDLELLVDGMIAKKPSLKNALRSGFLVFKVESLRFPGKLVDI